MIRSRAAREKAQSLIQMYGISSAPIEINEIAANLGFEIVPYEFPNSISAIIKIIDSRKVIGVNKKMPLVRQRFSIAHELGHYLSGHDDYSFEATDTHVDYSDMKRYADPQYRVEIEADEFAAELLMPENLLRKDFMQLNGNISELSKKFQVSEQAMIIQLVNLKLLAR